MQDWMNGKGSMLTMEFTHELIENIGMKNIREIDFVFENPPRVRVHTKQGMIYYDSLIVTDETFTKENVGEKAMMDDVNEQNQDSGFGL